MTFEPINSTHLLVLLGYALLELWLGRTQKTRAASMLELLFIGVVAMVTLLNSIRGKYGKSRSGESQSGSGSGPSIS